METITVDALVEKFERTPNYISATKRETGKSFRLFNGDSYSEAMNMLYIQILNQ